MFFAHVGYSLHILNSLKKYNKNKRFAILNKKHDLGGDNVKYGSVIGGGYGISMVFLPRNPPLSLAGMEKHGAVEQTLVWTQTCRLVHHLILTLCLGKFIQVRNLLINCI